MLLDAMCMDCAILLLMIVCSINGRNTITKRLQLPLNLQPSIKPETNNFFPTGEALSRTRRRCLKRRRRDLCTSYFVTSCRCGGNTRAEVGGELAHEKKLPHATEKTWNDVMEWEVGRTVGGNVGQKEGRGLTETVGG